MHGVQFPAWGKVSEAEHELFETMWRTFTQIAVDLSAFTMAWNAKVQRMGEGEATRKAVFKKTKARLELLGTE